MTDSIVVSSEFETREIGLVAYLELNNVKATEIKVIKQNSNGKKIAQFLFNKSEEALKMKNDYFNSESSAEPMAFMDMIRKIKTRINNLDA